ncbi:MAG: fasciclin domain-containing protein [Chitinophagales bacterium]
MKKIKLTLLSIIAAAFLIVSCTKEDQKNIVDLAKDNPNLSSLVAAIQRAGLVDALSASGNFTVFAPTNAAFSAFLSANGFANLDSVPVPLLQKVLLNHVLGTKKMAADITTGYVKTIGKYGSTDSYIDMYLSKTTGVKINGESNVTTADVEASNGVVHVVDKVIALPTVVTFATADPTFSTLVAAVTDSRIASAGLPAALSGEGPYTVFAPTNAAFTSLLTELSASGLGDISPATLEAVLKYHVVSGNILAGDLTDEQVVSPLLGSSTFTIDLTGGAKIKDASSRTSNIIVTDVQANNGVVHVIDKVILPAL